VASFIPRLTQVYWRYITADGAFVMVQDRNNQSIGDGWLFIKRACLSQVSGYPARSNAY
jgi:hypothetical protein